MCYTIVFLKTFCNCVFSVINFHVFVYGSISIAIIFNVCAFKNMIIISLFCFINDTDQAILSDAYGLCSCSFRCSQFTFTLMLVETAILLLVDYNLAILENS